RLFDLNPSIDIGIAPEQGTFADMFLLMCLFRDSPPISSREQAENDENKRRVVNHGRALIQAEIGSGGSGGSEGRGVGRGHGIGSIPT
ncbi:MAG: hypothetical protein EBT05_06260, partial [Betaproteobacteria bacterium]|nr:hypothetical protein [Betaproteobacteria bacterium]